MTMRSVFFQFSLRTTVMMGLLGSLECRLRAAVTVGPWVAIFQGVELARGDADAAEPRLQQVSAVRIELDAPGVELFTTPDNGDAPKQTTSETTGEFLTHYRLQVAINANFYTPCCTPGDKDLIGLAVSRGVVVSPPVTHGTGAAALIITRDHHATITKTGAGFITENIWTAVAGSEIVLVRGVTPAFAEAAFNRTPHPRTAVGLSKGARFLILLTIDGRQPGFSEGATMDEVAAWLRRFGAEDGLNLDGGGSTTLVRADGANVVVLNQPSGVALGSSDNAGKSGGERQQRSNGNNLGVFAKPLSVAK